MAGQVLRIELEGTTTSFRYPHFLVGRQPSFPMPPPATVYGHIASALGEFPDRATLRFAYSFTAAGKGDDLENTHLVEAASGRLDRAMGFTKNLEGNINPLLREVLLFPRMVLYLDAPGWLEQLERAFREPCYPVVLGRSQDLAAYRTVQVVDLEAAASGYLEGTLLPWTWRLRTPVGVMATMPRFIDPTDRRRVEWAPYVVLERRVAVREGATQGTSAMRPDPGEIFSIDPLSPEENGLRRIVVWHRFDGAHDGP